MVVKKGICMRAATLALASVVGISVSVASGQDSYALLNEQLDSAVRRSIPSAALGNVSLPGLHNPDAYVSWHYSEGEASITYRVSETEEDATELLERYRQAVQVGTKGLPDGTIGDQAFVTAPGATVYTHVYFRRGRIVASVDAPLRRVIACVFKPDQTTPQCPEPPPSVPTLPARLERVVNGLPVLGMDGPIAFADIFDRVLKRWK